MVSTQKVFGDKVSKMCNIGQKVSGDKVSDHKVSSHKVSKMCTIGQKVSGQKVSKTIWCVYRLYQAVNPNISISATRLLISATRLLLLILQRCVNWISDFVDKGIHSNVVCWLVK